MQNTPYGTVPPAPPQPERGRSLLYVLIGAGAALLLVAVVGGVLAYQALVARPAGIPQLLGADTQVYATLTPNLSDLPNVQRLQAAYPQLFVDEGSSDADAQLEELMGVTFAEDVQPWIGTEMAVAVSGVDAAGLVETQGDQEAAARLARRVKVTIVLAARDQAQAQAFLDKQRANREGRGQQFVSTVHQNVTIYAQQDSDGSPITAFALIKQHVVFASDAALLTDIIDRDAGGEDTLEKNPRFQAVRAALPTTAAGYVFVDGDLIGEASVASLRQGAAQLPEAQVEQLEQQIENARAVQGLGASVSVIPTGVQLDTALTMDLGRLDATARAQLEEARTPVDAARLAAVSEDAIGVMTFHIPASFKDQILEAIRIQPDGEAQLESLEQQLGVSLEDDLLSWMSGDASLVILPGERIADTTLPATGYLALRPADRDAAERGMQKIIGALQEASAGAVAFDERSVGGADWQVATVDPEGEQVVGGYGFIGDDLVVAFGTNAMEGASRGGEDPLSDEPTFKAVGEALVTPNGGVIYVNVERAIDAMRDADALPSDFDVSEAGENLKPIKAIGASGAPGVDDQGVARARLVVQIGE